MLALLTVLLAVSLFALAAGYSDITADLPSLDEFAVLLDPQEGALLQPTRLYDRSGQRLIYSLENPGIPRVYTPIDPDAQNAVSPQLVRATILSLQPDFWESGGYRLDELTNPEPATIAERLVLRLLLWREEPSPRRALRMRLLAAQAVARFGRAQVLEWYLNSENYGHLAFGPESAARLYFGKPASQLTLGEALLLAAVAQSPALNPLDAPVAAQGQTQRLIERLTAEGWLSSEEALQSDPARLRFQPALPPARSSAAAFSRMVLNQLNQRFGQDVVERGGWRVITSLDVDLQAELVCSTRVQLQRFYNLPAAAQKEDGSDCQAARLLPTLPPGGQDWPGGLSISSLILDPQTSEVLAFSGDTSLSGEKDLPGGHAPGTMLAPYIAAAALTGGLTPASLVWDIPEGLPPAFLETAEGELTYRGPLRLRSALVGGRAAALTRLLQQVGQQRTWSLAADLGAPGLRTLPQDGSALLEGGSLQPLELAQTLAVFSQEGVRRQGVELPGAVLILRIEDRGGRLLLNNDAFNEQPVVSQQLAYLVNQMLSDEAARWPWLGYPNSLEIGRPAAALTGKTLKGDSTWTAGYTPQRVVVVWAGWSDSSAGAPLDLRVAAGEWHALMKISSRGLPPSGWLQPAGISTLTVCDPSGLLPTRDCPALVTELFTSGNEPVAYDTLFQRIAVNRESGKRATVFTPPELVEERVYLVPPAFAAEWAKANRLPLPPADYDVIPAQQPSDRALILNPPMLSSVSGRVTISGTAQMPDFDTYLLAAGRGINPLNWLQIGAAHSEPVVNGTLAVWDTTGLEDGLYVLRLQVVNREQRLETALTQVIVDNTPPLARAVYPFPGQAVEASERGITLQAEVEDAGGIARVEWWLDGQKIGERRSAPFVYLWTGGKAGEHTLVVRAVDRAGNRADSSPLKFTLLP